MFQVASQQEVVTQHFSYRRVCNQDRKSEVVKITLKLAHLTILNAWYKEHATPP